MSSNSTQQYLFTTNLVQTVAYFWIKDISCCASVLRCIEGRQMDPHAVCWTTFSATTHTHTHPHIPTKSSAVHLGDEQQHQFRWISQSVESTIFVVWRRLTYGTTCNIPFSGFGLQMSLEMSHTPNRWSTTVFPPWGHVHFPRGKMVREVL